MHEKDQHPSGYVTTAEIKDAQSIQDLLAIAGNRPLSDAAKRLAAHRGLIEEDAI